MNVNYRQGKKDDSRRIAELDYIASGGVVEYLFHNLVPDLSAMDILSNGFEKDIYPHTFRSCIVAESEQKVIGMALSYPAQFHCVTEELTSFLPKDRMEKFHKFFSTRVEDSFFLDAMCVDEIHRGLGIGRSLLEQTKTKAKNADYSELSLMVFADNTKAIKLYKQHGFETVTKIRLERHELIPHDGGCLLMKCTL